MIDTHAHINIAPLYENVEDIINKATLAGVNKIIAIGINNKTNLRALKLAEHYPQVYATVGYHPSEIADKLDFITLEKQLNHPKVVGLGEIGLDLYWQKDNLVKQQEVFLKQIELAIKTKMPVVIHSRNSADLIYQLIKTKKHLKGVMHCYSEHEELSEKFIELGFYLGIGGIITFKNDQIVKSIALKTPLKRLLIETDSPYLAPTPYRGKTNEPKNVVYVLKALANLKKISEAALIKITSDNAKMLFSKIK